MDKVYKLCEISSVQLLASLHAWPLEARAVALYDFERARSHLIFAFGIRLSHCQLMPFRMFAMGDIANPDKARAACAEVLATHFNHPQIRLVQGPLRAQADKFIDGADIMDAGMERFLSFVLGLRLAFQRK